MEERYTFRYNAITDNIILYVVLFFLTMWVVAVNYLAAVGVIAVEIVLYYYLCRRTYLIIDKKGITRKPLFSADEYVEWSDVNGFFSNVSKGYGRGKKDGIGILRKGCKPDSSDQYDSDIHAMFIPFDAVAAPEEDVKKALRDSVEVYVDGRKPTKQKNVNARLAGWDEPASKQKKITTAMWVLFIAWLLLFTYFAHEILVIKLGKYGDAITRTLVDGHQYGQLPVLLFVIAFATPCLLPTMMFKKHYLWVGILLFVAMAFTTYEACVTLPELKLLYANCAEPTQAKIECVEGTVSKVYSGKSSYTAYTFIYENVTYTIKDKYLSSAQRGMPAKVYIIKGSRGIPIVYNIEIPSIRWSVNGGLSNDPVMEEPQAPKDTMPKPKVQKRMDQNPTPRKERSEVETWPFVVRWEERSLVVKGYEMGTWQLLTPHWPQHHFNSHYLSMMLAIQKEDCQAMFLFYDEQGGSYYPANISPTIHVESGGKTKRYTLTKDMRLPDIVWHFSPDGARRFIHQLNISTSITINCVSREDGTVKDYRFVIPEDE